MGVRSEIREAEFQAQMEALRVNFIAGLPARRAALASAWAGCADGGDEAPWVRVRDVAHKLAGSAPSYGVVEAGDAARVLDRLLSGRTRCRERADAHAAVDRLLAALDAAIVVA